MIKMDVYNIVTTNASIVTLMTNQYVNKAVQMTLLEIFHLIANVKLDILNIPVNKILLVLFVEWNTLDVDYVTKILVLTLVLINAQNV